MQRKNVSRHERSEKYLYKDIIDCLFDVNLVSNLIDIFQNIDAGIATYIATIGTSQLPIEILFDQNEIRNAIS